MMEQERELGEVIGSLRGLERRVDDFQTEVRAGFARLDASLTRHETTISAKLSDYGRRIGQIERWKAWILGSFWAMGVMWTVLLAWLGLKR